MEQSAKPAIPANGQRIKRDALLLSIVWSLLIAGSTFFAYLQARHEVDTIAHAEARVFFDRDVALRQWSATHGGVYVPVDEPRTPPNPHLAHIPDRDIKKPDGTLLTLMNPAYMIRQINADFAKKYGVAGHITSLTPLRQENGPDQWERMALLSFEKGVKEADEYTFMGDVEHLRLMRPIYTQKGCLKCHGRQGYKEGDVRGGVSISLPMTALNKTLRQQTYATTIGHLFIWLIGILGIGLGKRSILKREHAREIAELALHRKEEKYRLLVENLHDLVVKFTPEGKILYASPTYCRTFGKTEEDLLGKEFVPMIHPEDRAQVGESLQKIFKPPHTTHHEERAQTAEGYRWFSWAARGVPDEEGSIKEIISVGRDVSDRKEIELEKEKLIADLQKALDQIRVLRGMLPICAGCKKIRDDKGYWLQIESYIQKHSEATFTHGMCPDCAQKVLDEMDQM